jgi:hypothetical protein
VLRLAPLDHCLCALGALDGVPITQLLADYISDRLEPAQNKHTLEQVN